MACFVFKGDAHALELELGLGLELGMGLSLSLGEVNSILVLQREQLPKKTYARLGRQKVQNCGPSLWA